MRIRNYELGKVVPSFFCSFSIDFQKPPITSCVRFTLFSLIYAISLSPCLRLHNICPWYPPFSLAKTAHFATLPPFSGLPARWVLCFEPPSRFLLARQLDEFLGSLLFPRPTSKSYTPIPDRLADPLCWLYALLYTRSFFRACEGPPFPFCPTLCSRCHLATVMSGAQVCAPSGAGLSFHCRVLDPASALFVKAACSLPFVRSALEP